MAWSSLAIGSNPKVSMLVDDKPIVGGEDPDGAWRIAVYSCQATGVAASEEYGHASITNTVRYTA